MLQMKATSYQEAMLDQEGPAQTSWCCKCYECFWQAGHVCMLLYCRCLPWQTLV
jgi:hypothetical protein